MMNSEKGGSALDLDVALAHVDGDWQFLAELSAMFLQDYPRLMEEAHDSIQQKDHASLERAAHTLKGRLAFFGIHKLRERILELEMMGRNKNMALAAQTLADVEAEMDPILPEFESLIRKYGK